MDWLVPLQLAVAALLVLAQFPAIRRHWLENREEAARGWRIAGYYLAFCITGLVIVIGALISAAKPTHTFLAGCVFFIAWIVLGVSWMLKVSPKPKTSGAPRIVQPLHAIDILAMVVIALSLPFLLSL